MTLSVGTIGDNPFAPGVSANTYIPDQLIAGDMKLVTENVTIASGTLTRGTVLGQITGTAAVAAPTFSGTGNGTLTRATPAYSDAAMAGTYKAVCVEKTTDSGLFEVIRPDGTSDGFAVVGTAYDGQVKFTIADGATDFAQGDTFSLVVTIATPGGFIKSVATATDGSQRPIAILADNADASGGAVTAPVYFQGEFNSDRIVYDNSWTVATLKPVLRPLSIFLKSPVSNSDPS